MPVRTKLAPLIHGSSVLALALATLSCDGGGADEPRTFIIPVTPYFGTDVVECGRTYEGAGTTGASFELTDFLMFVYEVELVRESGETVPLELVDDQQWQGQGVALLDFNDATGSCAGDAETNRRLVGTAPDYGDYVGIRFGVGLPPELNHIDGVTAAAPLNKPSTWWSWKSGYKFFQMTLSTSAHESWFVHLGSTACEGSVESGFTCGGSHQMSIDVEDFVPGRDGLKLNVATLLAEMDLEAPIDFASGDFIAGCMSFDPDPQCDPLFSKFGRRFMSDEPGPDQIVFECDEGRAGDVANAGEIDDTPQPGSDAFERPEVLNIENVSERGKARSHPIGNTMTIGSRTYRRGPGAQCMQCHQEKGPGTGLFEVAGTVWNPDRSTPYGGATLKILPISAGPCLDGDEREHCQGQEPGFYREEDVVATLEADPNGNFYTTELPPEAAPPFWPVVEPAEGDEGLTRKFMGHPAASGSCNMCHGSIEIQLGRE